MLNTQVNYSKIEVEQAKSNQKLLKRNQYLLMFLSLKQDFINRVFDD